MPLGYIPGAHSGGWNALSYRLFGSRKFSRTIEFRIISEWLPTGKLDVLDLAAGSGEFSQQLALRGHMVTAFDCDAAALTNVNTAGVPPIGTVVGDAHELPFPEANFDVVVSNSSVEHFADDRKAFGEVARVLRPGGRAIITTDNFPSKVSPLLHLVPWFIRRPEIRKQPGRLINAMRNYHREQHGVVNYYTLEQLTGKLRAHGLDVMNHRHYMNGLASKMIFEGHVLVKWLDLYNKTSRRLFPLFYPFTFPGWGERPGYGLAVCAVKSSAR